MHADELERGMALTDRAIALNPDQPGWYQMARATRNYVGAMTRALCAQPSASTCRRFPKWHLTMAAVAGRLGLRDEARTALEALRRLDPAAGGDEYVRASSSWIWADEEMDRVVEGVRKARALVDGGRRRLRARGWLSRYWPDCVELRRVGNSCRERERSESVEA